MSNATCLAGNFELKKKWKTKQNKQKTLKFQSCAKVGGRKDKGTTPPRARPLPWTCHEHAASSYFWQRAPAVPLYTKFLRYLLHPPEPHPWG